LGRFWPKPSPSLSRARPHPPPLFAAQAAHRPRARAPLCHCQLSPTRQPALPLLSRDLSLPGKRVPLVSAFLVPVTGPATRSPTVATAPSSRHYSLACPIGALHLCPLAPTEPSSHPPAQAVPSSPLCHHPRRGKLAGAHHLSPPSPPRAPIKGPPELPPSPHRPQPLPLPSPKLN
jgi:hypothetical protein